MTESRENDWIAGVKFLAVIIRWCNTENTLSSGSLFQCSGLVLFSCSRERVLLLPAPSGLRLLPPQQQLSSKPSCSGLISLDCFHCFVFTSLINTRMSFAVCQ